MNALSNFAENALVAHLLSATAHVPSANLYFSLFTGNPGETGTANEITIGVGAYARVAVTNDTTNFPLCSVVGEPTKTNGAAIVFPKCTVAWGTATYWGVFDAATAGNLIAYGLLAAPRVIAANDTPKIAAGAMSITLSNSSAGGLTAYAKRKLLDLQFSKTTFTTPAAVYTGLGTALTGDVITAWTDGGNAVRVVTTYTTSDNVASGSAITCNATVATAATITHFGIWDAITAGNLLVTGPLTAAIEAVDGDSVGFASSALTFTLQ